jgi:hypothetical protein
MDITSSNKTAHLERNGTLKKFYESMNFPSGFVK